MKRFVVLLLLTAFTGLLYAQNPNCQQKISDQQFKQKYQLIKSKQNDNSRLQISKQLFRSFCLSSKQVKDIAFLYENDVARLKFTKTAYKRTIDKQNFYEVFDAFVYFSNAFRLYDFINNKEENDNNTGNENPGTNTFEFPNYNYPSYKNYQGTKNCSQVISKNSFNYIVSQLYDINNDQEKYSKAANLIKSNCLPTSDLMKIGSLFQSEGFKLKFASIAQKSVFDLDNYIEMKQIFNTPSGRNRFMETLGNQESIVVNTCKVSNTEYRNVITTIKNEKFNTNKINTAKHLIKSKKCFTALQIKGIIEQFSYENSKLEIAKYAYEFTINQSDYYITVSQALDFENSKKNLLNYINSKTL